MLQSLGVLRRASMGAGDSLSWYQATPFAFLRDASFG